MLESLSYTVKFFQTVTFATLLKRDPRTGVSEPFARRSSTKLVFLNDRCSKEKTCVVVFFEIKFRSRHSQMFLKIIVLKKFANFTGKQLCRSLL